MNKLRQATKIISGLVIGGMSVYLLILIASKPADHALPLLEGASGLVDKLNILIQTTTVLQASQVQEITSHINSLGSRPTEGFDSLVSGPGSESVLTYRYPRDKRRTGWRVSNRNPGEEVSWLTSTCDEETKTTFIFSGALGAGEGKTEFLVSGQSILTINTGAEYHGTIWEEDGCVLRFFPLRRINPNILCESGIFCLTIPSRMVGQGGRLEIRARSGGASGSHSQWSYFTLYDYTDTRDLLDIPLSNAIDDKIKVKNL